MNNKQVLRKIYIFISLLLLVLLILGGQGVSAFAGTTSYTTALTDLQKDSNFDISDYPSIPTDYSLQVIQIAESTDGELLVYVYNPCGINMPLSATCINMALSESSAGSQLFDLQLINRVGVFAKYLVKGVTVSDSDTRFYNVTSIYRRFNRYCDVGTGNDNTVSEVAFEVAKIYKARTVNGDVLYSCTTTETVTVTKKYVGGVRLGNGITWNGVTGVDAHFVAFDCDYSMDKLFKADVTFTTKTYSKTLSGLKESEVSDPIKVSLDYDRKVVIEANNFGNRYEWYEIETVDEFLSRGYELSAEAKREIKNMQYVLRFYYTEYNEGADGEDVLIGQFIPLGYIWTITQQFTKCSGTYVYDVSVLHLDFEADGVAYSLGVVDNKQSGSNEFGKFLDPDNVPWWVWLLVAVGGVAVVLILICAFVPGAAPVIGRIFATIGKALLWVILLPFRLIGALFKAIGNAISRRKATAAAKSTTRKTKTKKAGKKKK